MTPLGSLPIGTRFSLPCIGKTGTVLQSGPCSVLVKYDAPKERKSFTDRWGEVHTLEVEPRSVNIAPGAQVEVL